MKKINIKQCIQDTLNNEGIFFPTAINNTINPALEIAQYLSEHYKNVGYKNIEITDNTDTEDIMAVYCTHKGYEFMTYCFVCDVKEYQSVTGNDFSLEAGKVLACVVSEQLEYIYIKPSWITKLLRIATDPNEGDEVLASFRNTLKEIIKIAYR